MNSTAYRLIVQCCQAVILLAIVAVLLSFADQLRRFEARLEPLAQDQERMAKRMDTLKQPPGYAGEPFGIDAPQRMK